VIDDLTRVLTKKILTDATASIRACAEDGDRSAAEALVQALTRGGTVVTPPESGDTPE
jgi:glutamyl-tRNA reductase